MPAPKRVLCIMDNAVVGRCSMAAALPVIAACGAQPCPLPSVLYSTHTGGFNGVKVSQIEAFGIGALEHFKNEAINFDAVYTGYLCSNAQFELAEKAFSMWPDAFKIVDPAMADSGKMYSGLPANTPEAMQKLASHANLITPNLTEYSLLTSGYIKNIDCEQNRIQLAVKLAGENRGAVVTSLKDCEGNYYVAGCGPGGKDGFEIKIDHYPQNYPGTGDLFTSAMAGLLMAGKSLQQAVILAADFTSAAVQATMEGGGEVRHGVWFEPLLHVLSGMAKI